MVRAVPATIHLSRSTALGPAGGRPGPRPRVVRPAVGGQPQADGVGDGLGNIRSGRIGHPRGDPLVVIRVVRTHYPGRSPRAPPPPPAQSLPHHRADPRQSRGPPGEKGSMRIILVNHLRAIQWALLSRSSRSRSRQVPGSRSEGGGSSGRPPGSSPRDAPGAVGNPDESQFWRPGRIVRVDTLDVLGDFRVIPRF